MHSSWLPLRAAHKSGSVEVAVAVTAASCVADVATTLVVSVTLGAAVDEGDVEGDVVAVVVVGGVYSADNLNLAQLPCASIMHGPSGKVGHAEAVNISHPSTPV